MLNGLSSTPTAKKEPVIVRVSNNMGLLRPQTGPLSPSIWCWTQDPTSEMRVQTEGHVH